MSKKNDLWRASLMRGRRQETNKEKAALKKKKKVIHKAWYFELGLVKQVKQQFYEAVVSSAGEPRWRTAGGGFWRWGGPNFGCVRPSQAADGPRTKPQRRRWTAAQTGLQTPQHTSDSCGLRAECRDTSHCSKETQITPALVLTWSCNSWFTHTLGLVQLSFTSGLVLI